MTLQVRQAIIRQPQYFMLRTSMLPAVESVDQAGFADSDEIARLISSGSVDRMLIRQAICAEGILPKHQVTKHH